MRVQIALGLFFVAAALPKLVDPPSFAHMIYNYRLVPGAFVNLMALVMPWLELLAGLALILGIWTRTSAALVGALLLVFVAAISLNLARGNAIDCGCFDVPAAGKSVAERLADMRLRRPARPRDAPHGRPDPLGDRAEASANESLR